jgi:hypothetical protein
VAGRNVDETILAVHEIVERVRGQVKKRIRHAAGQAQPHIGPERPALPQ